MCAYVCTHVYARVHMHVGLPRTLSLLLQVPRNSVLDALPRALPRATMGCGILPGNWQLSTYLLGEYWAPLAPSSTTTIQQARAPSRGFWDPRPQQGWQEAQCRRLAGAPLRGYMLCRLPLHLLRDKLYPFISLGRMRNNYHPARAHPGRAPGTLRASS